MWLHAQTCLTLFYPLICTLPYCWELLAERKSGFLKYTLNRVSLSRYLLIRYATAIIMVSITIFFASFSSAVLAEMVLVPQHPTIHKSHIGQYLWGSVIVESPLTYAFFLSLWRAVLADVYFSFAFILALFGKNSFLSLTGAFIYSILENYFMSIIGCPENSMITSFYITRLSPGYTAPYNLLIGPGILVALCAVVFIFGIVKSRQGDMQCLGIV